MFLQGIQLHIMSSYLSCQSVCLTHLMSTEKYMLANTGKHIIIVDKNNMSWTHLRTRFLSTQFVHCTSHSETEKVITTYYAQLCKKIIHAIFRQIAKMQLCLNHA